MSYPSFEEYTDALRLPPGVVFQDPLLTQGSVRKNAAGVPFARSGNFALTYEVAVNGSRYAVRCFHKESDSLERRYEAISRKLQAIASPWFVEFDFQPAGIRTESGQFPIVRMQWADGCSLAQFISEHRDEPQTLLRLRETLRELARHLQAHDIAHGDIQPGNIIVRSATELKLVDYDGMFVPELEPWGGTELGQRNFQHPGRSWLHYDERLDRFSFALLDVALEALAMQPALWELTGSDEASLVLRAADFLDPVASTAFGVLAELDGLGVRARQLAVLCRSPFERVPALDDFLAGRRIPAAGPLTLTSTATATRPAYVPAYAVLDATNFARCCAHIGDRIELIGRVRRVVRESPSDAGRGSLSVEFGDAREDMVRLSIWPESGLESLAALEPGQWVSALGLVDPILTETSGAQPYKSVAIAISERSQVRLITQTEALHRLAANEGPMRADHDISITIGTDPAIPVVLPRPSPTLAPISIDIAQATPTVVLPGMPAPLDPPRDATIPIESIPVLEPPLVTVPVTTRSTAPPRLEPSFSASDVDALAQSLAQEPIVAAPPAPTRPIETPRFAEPIEASRFAAPIEPPRLAAEPIVASRIEVGGQSTAQPESLLVAPVATRPIARPAPAAEPDRNPPVSPAAPVAAIACDLLAPATASSVVAATAPSGPAVSVLESGSPRTKVPTSRADTVRGRPRHIDWPLRWPAFRMPGMGWPAFSWRAIRWPAFRLPAVSWPAVRWPAFRMPAVPMPTFRMRMPALRWPAMGLPSFGPQGGHRFAADVAARWSALQRSLAARPPLRIGNPLPRLRAALEVVPIPAGLPDRLRRVHPAWWLAAVLMAIVLVQSWIIARKPETAAAIDDRAVGSDVAIVQRAKQPRGMDDERAASGRPLATERQSGAKPAPVPSGLALPVATVAPGAPRATQGSRLLAFEYLTSARRPITTIAGPIDIVTRAGAPRLSLVAVNGKVLDQSAAELNMLVHRSVYADREVIVGFSDCLRTTPACERKEPFWVLLRRSQPPVFKRSPGLRANQNAGAVTALPSGVHVDLGLWDGVRQTATLTGLDDLYVARVRERSAPLSSADCRSVAAVLESCAASRVCGSYDGIIGSVPPDRVSQVQRLFHETTGLNAAMFRSVCVRSCELGLTPTSALVRREVCGGAVKDQWSQVKLDSS